MSFKSVVLLVGILRDKSNKKNTFLSSLANCITLDLIYPEKVSLAQLSAVSLLSFIYLLPFDILCMVSHFWSFSAKLKYRKGLEKHLSLVLYMPHI